MALRQDCQSVFVGFNRLPSDHRLSYWICGRKHSWVDCCCQLWDCRCSCVHVPLVYDTARSTPMTQICHNAKHILLCHISRAWSLFSASLFPAFSLKPGLHSLRSQLSKATAPSECHTSNADLQGRLSRATKPSKADHPMH
eukprot:scaffold134878_cov20-Tisochrysis_lutea.AAC.1